MKTNPDTHSAAYSAKTPNALLYLFRKCWQYSQGNRKSVVCFWTLFIFAGCIDVFVVPIAWAKIMDVVQTSGGITKENISTLLWLLLLMPASKILFWALHGPARVIERVNAFLACANFREFLMAGIMKLPLEWHAEHHSGNTVDKVNKGTQALRDFAEDSFEIIYAFVKLIGSCAVLVYFFPLSLPILIVMAVLTCWVIMRFDKRLVPQYIQLNKAENKITEANLDAISNITTVIILRVGLPVFKAIMEKVMRPLGLYRENTKINEIKWFLTSVCCVMTLAIVVAAYFLTRIGDSEAVLSGEIYLIWRYLGNINDLFYMVASRYGDTVKQKTQVMNADELSLDFKEETVVENQLPEHWDTLSIRGLNFSYTNGKKDGQEAPARLCNVNLDLHRGKRVAVIGKSGSGKTTFLKVMRDLYHPQSLCLSVDDIAISHGFKGIADAIALVPQNPELFTTTVWENITLGIDHDHATVMHYSDMACFTDVAASLPHGFESSVKEDGMNLSGGEQQRLALARALLASMQRSLLLLDESTSSLDAPTEVAVYDGIFREFSGRTIIASVHRLHMLRRFDRVLLFDKGQIVADGTFEELLEQCSVFQGMWQQYLAHPEE